MAWAKKPPTAQAPAATLVDLVGMLARRGRLLLPGRWCSPASAGKHSSLVTPREPQIWSLKKPAAARLSASPGTCSAPGRFPTSNCARDFWGHRGCAERGRPELPSPPAAYACLARAPGAAVRVSTRSPGRRWMAAVYHIRSITVGPPWGNDRELSAPLLLLGRRLLRLAVGAPIFLALGPTPVGDVRLRRPTHGSVRTVSRTSSPSRSRAG
jgi:hypothetical protein